MRKVGGRKKEKHLDEVLGEFGKRIYKTRLPNEPTTERSPFAFQNGDGLFSFCALRLFFAVVMDLISRNLSVHPSFP